MWAHFGAVNPCLGQRVNHTLAALAPGAASKRRQEMDLLALVGADGTDAIGPDRGGGENE